ncbi:hypothetical protein N7471_011192 [Penicillium samsonianum]|uniref:uncharacterized protein n=1 Tax=Penicillium samsonianum TaxID=1882272 RepID=UPI002548FB1A|nr:uncharacterized protein N7471_011192 [Penicillium samsonianum]KAJ6123875.1 hypothetical protein N7471_011192 [Penicillium samsonianum]
MEETFDLEDFESNYRDWETALYLALAANNRYYARMISHGIDQPLPPCFADNSPREAKALIIEDGTPESQITPADIRARVKEITEENKALRKNYNTNCIKWQTINNRACLQIRKTLGVEATSLISQTTDAREAFKKLRKTYMVSSHQQSYARYNKFVDMRFKNGTASDFIRKFQEAHRDLVATTGSMTPVMELCQFKKAIAENARCHAFLQNLKVNEKDPHLMERVYVEFVKAKTNNRSINPTLPTSANATSTNQASSSNNDKKKDKKGGTQPNSNNKDKDKEKSKKKTDFVREENVIFCSHHKSIGNHFSSKCPLKPKGSANTTTIQQPQPQIQQVPIPIPGQIIGHIDSSGRIISSQPQ